MLKKKIGLNELNDFLNENDTDFYIQEYKKKPFIIFYGWDEVEYVNNFLKKFDVNINEVLDYGFSDEYWCCSNCNNVINSNEKDTFFLFDDYLICEKCIKKNDDYIIDFINLIKNNPKKAINSIFIDDNFLFKLKYKKINKNTYEAGLHQWMDDDPIKIYNKLKNKYNNIIFKIDYTGQFSVGFDAFIKNDVED